VLVVGERIAQVAPSLPVTPGMEVIDATGKLVIPGGIDPHTHLQPAFVDDLASGSRAALAGGITTLGTFSAPRREETPIAALDRMTALVQQQAIADFILHSNAGNPRAEFLPFLPELVARGQPSIKVFMVGADFGTYLGAFVQLLEAARDAGVVTLVHCEDGALLAAAVRRRTAEGRTRAVRSSLKSRRHSRRRRCARARGRRCTSSIFRAPGRWKPAARQSVPDSHSPWKRDRCTST
jgi:dihydropyrimidinase